MSIFKERNRHLPKKAESEVNKWKGNMCFQAAVTGYQYTNPRGEYQASVISNGCTNSTPLIRNHREWAVDSTQVAYQMQMVHCMCIVQ